MQLSRLEKFRSRRQQPVEGAEPESKVQPEKDINSEFGTMSNISLLDQHSVLKKKAEGK